MFSLPDEAWLAPCESNSGVVPCPEQQWKVGEVRSRTGNNASLSVRMNQSSKALLIEGGGGRGGGERERDLALAH